jgi:hypothetical protein
MLPAVVLSWSVAVGAGQLASLARQFRPAASMQNGAWGVCAAERLTPLCEAVVA